ncbi:hypothetical protein RhiirA4_468150 [Rhizophagus irregularis]|uniref:Uncharacterized protein n=1 Tax=Rhizophagus irregularis TaxID=588596 RepID=A0A2I1GX79_9GLOM|nr:hypothetical protein RhiirA4_468150 [Rhizophagus irregularis]
MTNWKYNFERLSKHKYVAHIIHPKKVICICERQSEEAKDVDEEEEYDSDVYDNVMGIFI